ncbi:hypothetical protein JAAARDRAFT_126901 [Jaapia argillacea MUCL 33604]|uniref:Bacteriophage T5 Orf172 DNA-binding domain-containing protein n=1 Tax=Jaapia argillacea MUCL 33604 TaxID=933084 RepID=A0A067Q7W6_9AGAM|nr:hypothetical protein JAAARDRAFT_126901 [Jaapia argillacea MUCL 33604]
MATRQDDVLIEILGALALSYIISPVPQQPNTPPRPNLISRPPIPSASGSPYTPTRSDTSNIPRPRPHPDPHSAPPPSKLDPPTSPHQRPPHTRPHSDSALPPPAPQLASSISSPPRYRPLTTKPSPGLATPPNRGPRAVSTPTTPISASTSSPTRGTNGTVQCSGYTATGKQCTRQVKLSDVDVGGGEKFCHQHTKVLMVPSGFFSRKGGSDWIGFKDWIPDHLSMETQAALRAEMEKARSLSDEPGYIYTFEILDPTTPTQLHLKVGRTTNLAIRLNQWANRCGSKEQVVRGFYPDPQDFNPGEESSLMKGRIKPGEKVPWCHRLERLIHLELGDLVESGVYREAGWPTNVGGGKDGKDGTKGKGKDAKLQTKRCPDCGSLHKEIFTFARIEREEYKGKEWESIVKPIIEKWGGFVEAYV